MDCAMVQEEVEEMIGGNLTRNYPVLHGDVLILSNRVGRFFSYFRKLVYQYEKYRYSPRL